MFSSLSFVIPVRNDAGRLERCLTSILANNYPSECLQVIVADNGSIDGSPAVARKAGAEVVVLPGLRVSRMRNEAAAIARGEVLALVDADHELAGDWISAAIEALEDTGAAAVGAHYDAPRDATWVQRAYDRFRHRSARREEVDWLGSGNLAIRADVFRGLCGFDASLESCEDVELCNRLRAGGHRLVYEPRMRSIHHGDPATLKALFLSELWRGRDNLRVTFRGPLTLRALPSVIIPIANVVTAIGAPVLAVVTGRWEWGGAPVVTLAAATLLRAARMARAVQAEDANARESRLAIMAQNTVVAAVYEAGRAAALVVRASHKTRRA